jgi:hypothetical protein
MDPKEYKPGVGAGRLKRAGEKPRAADSSITEGENLGHSQSYEMRRSTSITRLAELFTHPSIAVFYSTRDSLILPSRRFLH